MNTSIIFYLDGLSRSKKPELLRSSSLLSCYIQAWTLIFFSASGFPSPALPHLSVTKSSYCCWQAYPASCFLSIHFFARSISPLVPCYWQITNQITNPCFASPPLAYCATTIQCQPPVNWWFLLLESCHPWSVFNQVNSSQYRRWENMRKNRRIKWIVRWLLRAVAF